MLDKSVRIKKEELRKKWGALREIALDEKLKNVDKLRYKQDEIYNKWNFYNNLIKSMERGNYEMQDQKNRKR